MSVDPDLPLDGEGRMLRRPMWYSGTEMEAERRHVAVLQAKNETLLQEVLFYRRLFRPRKAQARRRLIPLVRWILR